MEKKADYKKSLMIIIDAVIMVLLILFDRFCKNMAIEKLKGNKPFVLIDGVFELNYLENPGTAWGMLSYKTVLILVIGIFFMALIGFVLVKLPPYKKYLACHIVIAFLLAGGLGNMIDRFMYGYVVDFFSFVLIHFPVFNTADIFIVCATIAMFILFIFVYKEEDLNFLKFKKKG